MYGQRQIQVTDYKIKVAENWATWWTKGWEGKR